MRSSARAAPSSWPARPRSTPRCQIVGDGVVGQFEQALTNLPAALRAAGGEPEHLASPTVYIVDMDDYRAHAAEIGQVMEGLVGREYPAMAGIGIARLLGRRGAGRGPGLRRPPLTVGLPVGSIGERYDARQYLQPVSV